jgi:hypothetical protein
MIKYYQSQINRLNDVLKKNTILTNMLVHFFDYASKFTHFFLFNFFGYIGSFLLLFFIPIYFTDEFINFFITIFHHPENIILCFKNLPFALQLVFLFYVFLLDLVFFCTFLASIPLIRIQMIEKYKDSLILKKRGYNMLSSSVRRATTLGIPLTAPVIIAGDVYQHSTSIDAILQSNQHVWDEFQRTGDRRILERLQKIPTGGVATRINEVTVRFLDTIVQWKSGSKTKD